jgi:hypothetical protein
MEEWEYKEIAAEAFEIDFFRHEKQKLLTILYQNH